VAGGGSVTAIRAIHPLKVKLFLEDREIKEGSAVASILPGEDEVIISNRPAYRLGLVILDPYNGL